MIPLRDHNRPAVFSFFTYVLIALNALVYFYQASLFEAEERDLVRELALKPAFVTAYLRGEGRVEYPEFVGIDRFTRKPRFATEVVEVSFWNALFPFLTSMFLHGGILHLLGNIWFLHVFGDNVEDRVGRLRYLLFYLLTGFAASVVQVAMSPDSPIPCIGASGAISGVLGGYARFYPHARVVTLVPLGFFLQLLEIPAFLFLFVWFGIQVASGLLSDPGMGGVAWWAHIGGFVAGFAAASLAAPPRRRYRRIAVFRS